MSLTAVTDHVKELFSNVVDRVEKDGAERYRFVKDEIYYVRRQTIDTLLTLDGIKALVKPLGAMGGYEIIVTVYQRGIEVFKAKTTNGREDLDNLYVASYSPGDWENEF